MSLSDSKLQPSQQYGEIPIPVYDIWLCVQEGGAGPLELLGTNAREEAERIAQAYQVQARYTGYSSHFQYVVYRRGDPPPQYETSEDNFAFGDSRLLNAGTTIPSSSPLLGTFLEEEILGPLGGGGEEEEEEEEEEENGATTYDEAGEEENLLVAFLRGEILHEKEEEPKEPDEVYRETWAYRHEYIPPGSSHEEETETGEEEDDDDALFFL